MTNISTTIATSSTTATASPTPTSPTIPTPTSPTTPTVTVDDLELYDLSALDVVLRVEFEEEYQELKDHKRHPLNLYKESGKMWRSGAWMRAYRKQIRKQKGNAFIIQKGDTLESVRRIFQETREAWDNLPIDQKLLFLEEEFRCTVLFNFMKNRKRAAFIACDVFNKALCRSHEDHDIEKYCCCPQHSLARRQAKISSPIQEAHEPHELSESSESANPANSANQFRNVSWHLLSVSTNS